MTRQTAAVVVILAMGVFGRNNTIIIASLVALALILLPTGPLLPWLATNGIQAGIFILMLAVLADLGTGRVQVTNLVPELWSVRGVLSLLGGIAASWLSARGIELLVTRPQVTIGLVVGSVIATVFLRGVPIGPLFAAGLTAVFLQVWQMFSR